MVWYGQMNANNPLSGSATHGGQQGPMSSGVDHQSVRDHTYAVAPVARQIYNPPSYVICNNVGTYKFAYALTGSIGATLTEAKHTGLFITASVLDANTGPIRLDIQPSAWGPGSGDESTGDVTFVYRGSKG